MIDPDASYYKSSASSELDKSKAPTAPAKPVEPDAYSSTSARNVFLFLLAFRLLNALCVRTFFQPDEYFQSLEPAWDIAFGPDSGAWITWEWRHELRSSFHPYLFAAVYRAADSLAQSVGLSAASRAELLVAAPKVFQACIAAAGDYFTWKLGERVYGHGSYGSWTSLFLSVCSAWQWFCSTRTFSNCLETTLTVIALDAWPWGLASSDVPGLSSATSPRKISEKNVDPPVNMERLQRSLFMAALACILRPTNLLIWLVLGGFLVRRVTTIQTGRKLQQTLLMLFREAVLSGGLVLAITATFDRYYYQHWTLPPFQFLYYNIAQSLAIFYGSNDWHYYLSQGYPLLLTTYLPFAAVGLIEALKPLRRQGSAGLSKISTQLAIVTLTIPLTLSLIAHKEVRFIYPLLPILHVLSASAAISCFEPALNLRPGARGRPSWSQFRPWALVLVLGINVHIAIFTTQSHQLGPSSALSWLRHEHEAHFLNQPPAALHIPQADTTMTVGFLMPCHSTPWRSHLVHRGIKAWALGCEPPVDLDADARAAYLDEADQFYADPKRFLKDNLGAPPKRRTALGTKTTQRGTGTDVTGAAWDGKPGKKIWPEYLVFFGALEPTLAEITKNSGYSECWRGWSSWVHDDARRRGHVVIWCLHRPAEANGR